MTVSFFRKVGFGLGLQDDKPEDALKWAAKTYLVAALAAVTYLLYYLAIMRD